ncbi:transcription antitermination factor NusG [Desulfohalotomaculum tongense]|uniref:transcription termination/antitermination NusG family protein n=1 Tax=Desulforadius tongensis TaxID=1216062 RepID=UPI0019566D1F|nr:transcription termination/antitermination NusG family protein [Desulforadius tongensis]MBM7854971.1 transcription antitermination factor NusG [Desulforadius tongensis]
MRWVVLKVITGKEYQVARNLIKSISRINSQAVKHIEEIFAPVKKVAVFSATKVRIESVVPGYIFVKCNLTDELWHYLRYATGVFGLLDGRGSITDEQVDHIKAQCESEAELDVKDRKIIEAIIARYKEAMEIIRGRKSVIRLPLKLVRALMCKIQNLTSPNIKRISGNGLIKMLLESMQLVV